MSGKIYSHIDKIPSGSASRKVTEGCLVLEGGAFRGLYSQGFMDAMMKAIQEAYWIAKEKNRKFVPKKYRSTSDSNSDS